MRSSVALLPALDDALSSVLTGRLEVVEVRLRETVATSDHLVQWTGRHLLDAGGKRIRPLLVLLGGCFGDVTRDAVVDVAVLVELTHLATLYHDDVMDDASTRRGQRTAHQVWGNSVAILTGDFLFARASALSAVLGPDTVAVHARTFERLCMGQLHETVGPQVGEDPFEHYLGVLADKTASLISSAGELGALMAGAPAEVPGILRAYGEKVGIAFQLADDVLDLRGDPGASGKTPGTDLREGVPTMPTLLVRRRAQENPGDARTAELVALLDSDLSDPGRLERAVSLLREDVAVDETARLARSVAQDARDILATLPDTPARAALMEFTDALVLRSA